MDLQFLNTIFANHKQNEYKRIGWEEATDQIEKDFYKSHLEKNATFDNLADCQNHIEKLEKYPSVVSIWITPNSFLAPRSHAEGMLGQITWMFIDVDYISIDKVQLQIDEFTAEYNLYPSVMSYL